MVEACGEEIGGVVEDGEGEAMRQGGGGQRRGVVWGCDGGRGFWKRVRRGEEESDEEGEEGDEEGEREDGVVRR